MDELVSAELEALEYTYGSEAVVVLQQTPLHVQVSIAPHTGDLATERYVNADLILRATEAYPAEAPTTRVVQARGMSDARIEVVMSRLQAEASNLLGEMMLGSLIETARDVMTDINQPEGNCIYCLEGLVPAGGDPDSQAQALLRLPCYHTFHLHCFSRWWQWRQTSMAQQAAQLKQDLQSAANQRLEAEGLIPNDDGVFSVLCPVCRTLIAPQDLQHMDTGSSQVHDAPQTSATLQSATSLTAEEMRLVKSQQQKRAKQFAQQQSQGSIVPDRYGTSIEALANADQPMQGSTSLQTAQMHTDPQHHRGDAVPAHSTGAPFQPEATIHHAQHRKARGGRYRGRHPRGRGRGQHNFDLNVTHEK